DLLFILFAVASTELNRCQGSPFLFAVSELIQALQSECGSSDKSCACSDEVNRHLLHQLFEAAFSGESIDELWFLQQSHQVKSNAASQVHSTGRQNFQGKIASLACQN